MQLPTARHYYTPSHLIESGVAGLAFSLRRQGCAVPTSTKPRGHGGILSVIRGLFPNKKTPMDIKSCNVCPGVLRAGCHKVCHKVGTPQ